MTRSDPTGNAYRTALVDVRAATPHAAAPIKTHVDHLQRLLARLQAERGGLEARIAELAAQRSGSDGGDTNFLVVTADGSPVATSSSSEVVAAAMSLVEELLKNPTVDTAAATTAAAVRFGPLSSPIFALALQTVVEEFRPIIDVIRLQIGQSEQWPWA